MGKPYKIKRHKRIYRRSAGSIVLRIVIIAAAVGILFALGWALYTPVSNWIEQRQNRPQDNAVVGESQIQEPAESTDTEPEEESNTQQSPSSVQATAYLPIETVADSSRLASSLDLLKQAGYDSVMFDLKAADGTVNYAIDYQETTDARVTSASPVDLNAVVSQIKQAGLIPVASVYTFRDHLYPSADNTAATHYKDSDFLWVDNDPQKGGKPWINPFSESGQNYIKKIVDDACAAGFEMIVLQGTQFPEGYSLDMIDYGEHANEDKNAFLKQYLQQMTEYAAQKGVDLTGFFSAANILGVDNQMYFGEAADIVSQNTVVDFSLNVFGNGITTDSVSIPQPAADPYNTLKTAGAAVEQALGDRNLIAFFDAEGMTAEELSALQEEIGVSRCIIQNPPL